jgi:hypothetical protein
LEHSGFLDNKFEVAFPAISEGGQGKGQGKHCRVVHADVTATFRSSIGFHSWKPPAGMRQRRCLKAGRSAGFAQTRD